MSSAPFLHMPPGKSVAGRSVITGAPNATGRAAPPEESSPRGHDVPQLLFHLQWLFLKASVFLVSLHVKDIGEAKKPFFRSLSSRSIHSIHCIHTSLISGPNVLKAAGPLIVLQYQPGQKGSYLAKKKHTTDPQKAGKTQVLAELCR